MNVVHRRLQALEDYQIMDTMPEEAFDDLTRLASFICGTPIALVTLLDHSRQWFKSKFGLEGTETPIQHAFCKYAILQKETLVVNDATLDDRFAENPYVTGEPHIRFYAGAQLVTPSGVPLGTLCAIDRVPRELSPEQLEALGALARQVIRMLELRKTANALYLALDEKQEAQREVSTLQELLPMCAWCHNVRDDESFWHSVEKYISENTHMQVTHGVCPTCSDKLKSEMEQSLRRGALYSRSLSE